MTYSPCLLQIKAAELMGGFGEGLRLDENMRLHRGRLRDNLLAQTSADRPPEVDSLVDDIL